MKKTKKQGAGTIITIIAIILSVVGLVAYFMALNTGDGTQVANGGEMFLIKEEFGSVTVSAIVAIAAYVLGLAISEIKANGIVEMIGYVLRAAAPAIMIYTFVWFLNGTLTGLGWTFFSNEELAINEVAKQAGYMTITGLVAMVASAVAGIVASFCKIKK